MKDIKLILGDGWYGVSTLPDSVTATPQSTQKAGNEVGVA